MKVLISLLMALCLAFTFGCAQKEDVQIAQAYYKAVEKHDEKQEKIVVTKASSIKEMMSVACPPGQEDTYLCGTVQTLAKALAARDIASIETKESTLKPMKTSLDVQDNAVTQVGNGVPFLTVGGVSVKAIDKDKGSVTNKTGTGNIDNRYEENHATTVNSDSATANNAPVKDYSTKTEVAGEEEEEVIEGEVTDEQGPDASN